MTVLVVATGNPGKLREMQTYLSDKGWELQLKPPELEIEETEDTFAANACLKRQPLLRLLENGRSQMTLDWKLMLSVVLRVSTLHVMEVQTARGLNDC
jgi:hypothetical protein